MSAGRCNNCSEWADLLTVGRCMRCYSYLRRCGTERPAGLKTRPVDTSWHDQAVCATTDPEAFFPEKYAGGNAQQAKRICRSCPVQQRCLDDNLDEPSGVWGGLGPISRRRLREQRGRERRVG